MGRPQGRSGAVAGGNSPATMIIAHEFQRIVYRILLLDISCASTVLKIIAAFLAHEPIADSAEVDPDMCELMDKQGARIQMIVSVQEAPAARLVAGLEAAVT